VGSSSVAYNSSDPLQAAFLSALALGETGGAGLGAAETGFGSTATNPVSLAGYPTDAEGFPIWPGSSTAVGPTHAAGIFQFQQGTWDPLAQEYGLNFSNPADQEEGAWYEAQQTYQAATGQSLETALQNGDYSSIQSALSSVWPSVNGSGSNNQGLSAALANGLGPNLSGSAPTSEQQQASANSVNGTQSGSAGLVQDVEDFFLRFGLIITGGIIIIVALWQLLSSTGVVTSPEATVKAVGHAARQAGAAALAA
jgi:hypothetical protein